MMEEPVMNIIRVDCQAGISGDMLVSAFHDLVTCNGNEKNALIDSIKAIERELDRVHKIDAGFRKEYRQGFLGQFLFLDIDETVNHHSSTVDEVRSDLETCLNALSLSNEASDFALECFKKLAIAEEAAHGIHDSSDHETKSIHLHEIASVDTIVDISCVARALEILDFFDESNVFVVHSTPLAVGAGQVKIAHGLVPVPAPATRELLERNKIPFVDGPIQGELATPTGVAILATLQPSFEFITHPSVRKCKGVGVGAMDNPGLPNILQVELIETFDGNITKPMEGIQLASIERLQERTKIAITKDTIVEIATMVDDMPGEDVGSLMEHLFDLDILDAWFIPVHGKKQRPGVEIKVLCEPALAGSTVIFLLEQSTTLGCRIQLLNRVLVNRESKPHHVTIKWEGRVFSGTVRVKRVCRIGTQRPDDKYKVPRPMFKIEHDDLVRVANELRASIPLVRELVLQSLK
ncbi:DUF111 family protein [Candidatus Bathyarchaeota archaeon]|nr:DUF111 family protein [Candidatus Bathyarchaeota archaeon]